MERAFSGIAGAMASRLLMKTRSIQERVPAREYPADPGAYIIMDVCGRGVTGAVHRAMCKPLHELVAIKRICLDGLPCDDLTETIREALTMKRYYHPNVLPLHCSFVSGQELWMVMPFIAGGSVLHIMKYAHPEGLEEVIIATIMRDVLKALEYVHKQGAIHRDIKAGNILLDTTGHVLLGDFGVSASMERSRSWGNEKVARMTFVGTPCWMAPEVMEQTNGYDSSADIWSFGITLLELAYGQPPYAKFPPMKVLMMTLQRDPPVLEDRGGRMWSKAMREVVAMCLQKDPQLRPTASQLLEHKFFKHTKDVEYLCKQLMAGLPALQDRMEDGKQGRAVRIPEVVPEVDATVPRPRADLGDHREKGSSSWNFDVASLKAQAALEEQEEQQQQPGSYSLKTAADDTTRSHPLWAH